MSRRRSIFKIKNFYSWIPTPVPVKLRSVVKHHRSEGGHKTPRGVKKCQFTNFWQSNFTQQLTFQIPKNKLKTFTKTIDKAKWLCYN